MNLPRISWRRFLASRWAAWTVVLLLLVSGGFGGARYVEMEEELKVSRVQTEELRERVEKQSFELAQAEWALSQAKNKDTKKVREERRADGTVIVEREESTEATTTESNGSSTTQTTKKEEVDREQVTRNEEETERSLSIEQAKYFAGGGASFGLDLELGYNLLGGFRLGGLPLWLVPTLELDGTTYLPVRFGLGITFEF